MSGKKWDLNRMDFYEIGLKQWPESLPPEALMMAREEITRYPVSRLTELYLQQNM